MINDKGNSDVFETLPEPSTQPPRFDRKASVTARPVEPLSRNDSANWKQRFGSVRQLVNGQTRALAIVVIMGLATGTLGGMLLAKRNQPAVESSPMQSESVSEVPIGEAQQLDSFAGELNETPGSTHGSGAVRIRKTRPRVRSHQASRAYRAGVIRE